MKSNINFRNQLDDTPDEDIVSGQIKSFSDIEEMLDSLKQPWEEDHEIRDYKND